MSKYRHRYSKARREDAAHIIDICVSSRRERFEDELGDRFFSGHISPNDLSFLTELHWRSVKLASTAFYATMYDPHLPNKFDTWEYLWAEAAQRLREGWVLTGDEYCASWAYE
jgi:hypothetical protein